MKSLITWLGAAAVMAWLIVHETGMLEEQYGPERSPGNRVLAEQSAPQGDWVALEYLETPVITWAPARLTARHEVHVSPQVSGQILNLALQVGQTVEVGEVMANIDPTSFQIAVKKAQAGLVIAAEGVKSAKASFQAAMAGVEAAEVELTFAQIESDRQDKLIESESTTDIAHKAAKAKLASAKVGVVQAIAREAVARTQIAVAESGLAPARETISACELALSRTAVLAPLSGIVTKRHQESGSLGSPESPMVSLRATKDLRISGFFVEENVINVGDELLWRIPSRELTGKASVESTGSQVDSVTLTRVAHVPLEGIDFAQENLVPGTFCQLGLVTGKQELLLVPVAAIKRRGQVMSVRIERQGKPIEQHIRAVRPEAEALASNGLLADDWLVVLAGLQVNDRVEVNR